LWFIVKVAEPYQRKSAVSICGNLREKGGLGDPGQGEKGTRGKWDFEVDCSSWFVVKRFGIWPRCIGVKFGILGSTWTNPFSPFSWGNRKFTEYFEYLVIMCLYGQAF